MLNGGGINSISLRADSQPALLVMQPRVCTHSSDKPQTETENGTKHSCPTCGDNEDDELPSWQQSAQQTSETTEYNNLNNTQPSHSCLFPVWSDGYHRFSCKFTTKHGRPKKFWIGQQLSCLRTKSMVTSVLDDCTEHGPLTWVHLSPSFCQFSVTIACSTS